MRSSTAMMRVLLTLLAVSATAAISMPLSAGARGGAPGRGGGGAGGGGKAKNGCHHKLHQRTFPTAGKRKHQPFVEYVGTISTPAGQPYPAKDSWTVAIDRCKRTPRVAIVTGTLPGYYCGSTKVYANNKTFDFYHFGGEPKVHNGKFTFSAKTMGYGLGPDTVTGSLTGKVKIPKHGRGKGSGQINGTVVESTCPSQVFHYTAKFRRTWSSL